MDHYLNGVETCLVKLANWRVKHIPCEENGKTVALTRVVVALPITKSIMLPIYVQPMPSIALEWVHDIAGTDVGWMQPIVNYLCTSEVLEDEKQAHKLRVQVVWFTLINNQLFKWFFGEPYLKCLIDSKAQYVLAELHESVCGNHPKWQTLTHRAYSQGYY